MPTLPDERELLEWFGYDPNQRARLESKLIECRIPYWYGRGKKICTTLEAINAALIQNQDDTSAIEFD